MPAQQCQAQTGIKTPCFTINLIYKNMGEYLTAKTTQGQCFKLLGVYTRVIQIDLCLVWKILGPLKLFQKTENIILISKVSALDQSPPNNQLPQ